MSRSGFFPDIFPDRQGPDDGNRRKKQRQVFPPSIPPEAAKKVKNDMRFESVLNAPDPDKKGDTEFVDGKGKAKAFLEHPRSGFKTTDGYAGNQPQHIRRPPIDDRGSPRHLPLRVSGPDIKYDPLGRLITCSPNTAPGSSAYMDPTRRLVASTSDRYSHLELVKENIDKAHGALFALVAQLLHPSWEMSKCLEHLKDAQSSLKSVFELVEESMKQAATGATPPIPASNPSGEEYKVPKHRPGHSEDANQSTCPRGSPGKSKQSDVPESRSVPEKKTENSSDNESRITDWLFKSPVISLNPSLADGMDPSNQPTERVDSCPSQSSENDLSDLGDDLSEDKWTTL